MRTGYASAVLHEFLIANRGDILALSRAKLAARHIPTPTESELADGLPLFLDQIVSILRAKKSDRSAGHDSVSASAAVHGGELQRIGLTVGQVVQDYGSICQSVTELADEVVPRSRPPSFRRSTAASTTRPRRP
jgi:hypothetical protein